MCRLFDTFASHVYAVQEVETIRKRMKEIENVSSFLRPNFAFLNVGVRLEQVSETETRPVDSENWTDCYISETEQI